MEQNKIVTYYVIKDLATWTTRGCKQSVCERYEHAEEAMQQFRDYAQWQTVIEDKRIRATLGIRIKGLDFDVVYRIGGKNALSLEFHLSSSVNENQNFLVALQNICQQLPVSHVRIVLVLAFLIMQRVEDMNTIGNITTLVPLLFLPWTKELSRSFVYGTVELEISTRFTLRQVLFSRIALIGFVDIFLLTICSLFVARNFSFGICQTIMYLLVPFLFTVIGCLFVLNHFSSRRNELYCGGWCGMIMILFYYFSHWEEKFFSKALLLGWYSAFFVALVIIGIELHLLLKKCTRQYFIEY